MCLISVAMMSWVGCLLTDSELFILFEENSQILLKISVIPSLLTFMYLVALNLLVNNQLNSSLRQKLSTKHIGKKCVLKVKNLDQGGGLIMQSSEVFSSHWSIENFKFSSSYKVFIDWARNNGTNQGIIHCNNMYWKLSR